MHAVSNREMIWRVHWRESSRLSQLTSGLVVFRAMCRVRASTRRYRCISRSMLDGGAFFRLEGSTMAGTTRRACTRSRKSNNSEGAMNRWTR